MCCRYYIDRENISLREIGEKALQSSLSDYFFQRGAKAPLIEGEIRPNDIVPVIATSRNGSKATFPMQWGYHMKDRSLLANARSESAAEKPLFQKAWEAHRCVIPASWYYEWEHFLRPNGKKETGAKYLIQPKGDRVTWLCGLYRFEDGLPHFVVLTRPPSEELSFIHDRMPLMLREKDVDEWISPDAKPDEIAYRAVTDLHYEKAVQTEKAPPPVPDLFLPSTFE